MIDKVIDDCIKRDDLKTAMIIIAEMILKNDSSLKKIEERLEELENGINKKSEKRVEGITFG